MDYKRVDLIFLCTFLILNIFLLYTFFEGEEVTAPLTEMGKIENIELRLKGENISFEKDFSNEVHEGYYLSGVSTDFNQLAANKSGIRVTDDMMLEGEISSKDAIIVLKENNSKKITETIQNNSQISFGKEYYYNPLFSQDKNRYYFSQQYEKIPFYDETSALILTSNENSPNKVTYTETHIEMEPLREKQILASEHDAIVTLYMSSKIPNGSKIKQTALAYTRIYTVDEKNVYIPAWLVWLEIPDNAAIQVEKVNAFSNAIISTTIPEVKNK